MKIKNLLIAILVTLVWSLFVYGCISFFYMQLNPKLWAWDGRFFQVFFGFGLGVLIAGYTISFKDN